MLAKGRLDPTTSPLFSPNGPDMINAQLLQSMVDASNDGIVVAEKEGQPPGRTGARTGRNVRSSEI